MNIILNPDPNVTPGQTAYEAYCQATGNLTYGGAPTLGWEELPSKIQNAWETSAHRVRTDTLTAVIKGLEQTNAELGL